MHKPLLIGSMLAFGAAGPTLAADLSYTYVEGAYVNSEVDDFDLDGDGYSLFGSVGFWKNFFGFAGYSDSDYDGGVGSQFLELGAGAHWSLSPAWDAVGAVAYVDADVDVSGFGSASADGYMLAAGLRGRVTQAIELFADVEYVDLGNTDDTGFVIGGRYYLTDAFALGANIGDNGDGTHWSLVLRYDFGNE